jgi:exosortase D (VPLPA-CTERM-specific)
MVTKKAALPVTPLVLGGLLLLAVIWFFLPVLTSLFALLAESEDYSFGLLLPLVSAYIVYLKWPQIRNGLWRPSWLGLLIIAAGLILFAWGALTVSVFIPRLAFVMVMAGLLFLVGGWKFFRLLSFPVMLLLLMIPGPEGIMKQLTFPLQLISSNLAASLLQTVGIPVVRQGNVIDLGVRQLQVVQACSGLRYILSLLALGIIYCYFYQRSLWKAALLLLSLIPAAILANGIRVAAMGIFPALQEGFLHSFSGWLIFVFCFGLMGLLNWLLNYLQPQTAQAQEETNGEVDEIGSGESGRTLRPSHTSYLLVALAIVILFGPLDRSLTNIKPLALLKSFQEFPLTLGSWQGQSSPIDPEIFKATGADAYFAGEYVNHSREAVSLWIAYYGQHTHGMDLAHNPKICMVGGGWQIIDSGVKDIGPGMPVNYLVMQRGSSRTLVYYWHLQQGHWVANINTYKLYMGVSGLFRRRTDWALVRLITPIGKDLAVSQERLLAFAHLLIPVLPNFMLK